MKNITFIFDEFDKYRFYGIVLADRRYDIQAEIRRVKMNLEFWEGKEFDEVTIDDIMAQFPFDYKFIYYDDIKNTEHYRVAGI